MANAPRKIARIAGGLVATCMFVDTIAGCGGYVASDLHRLSLLAEAGPACELPDRGLGSVAWDYSVDVLYLVLPLASLSLTTGALLLVARYPRELWSWPAAAFSAFVYSSQYGSDRMNAHAKWLDNREARTEVEQYCEPDIARPAASHR